MARILAAICVWGVLTLNAFAQPAVVIPSNPDSYWYSSAGSGAGASPIIGLNTAMISYGTPGGPANYMFSSAYYDASGTEVIYVNDPSSGSGTASPSTTMYSVPDLIIGNNSLAPTKKYILACAYIDGSSNIVIDYFSIVNFGGTFYSFSYVTSNVISGYLPGVVHLDVIADQSNTLSTNFPFCDNFIITWDDYSGGSPNVYAQEGNLNSHSLTSAVQLINPAGSGIYGYAPDVAAVRRTVSGPPVAIHDFALIPYVDAGGNILYYREWDVTSGLLANTTIDPGGNSYVANPRIDAWDDYTYNSSASWYSVYKIVAQADTVISATPYSVVRTYDNVTYPGNFPSSDVIDITPLAPTYSGYPAPYNDFSPTVAVSGPIDYRVQHYMNYGVSGNDIVFMEPINLSNPWQVLANTYYYWINSQSSPLPYTTDGYGVYANAVAGPSNNPYEINVVYAWAFYNSSSTTYDVDYKIPSPGVYSFKHGLPSSISNIHANGWSVFPNPATNMITVQGVTSFNSQSQYHILDVTGRQFLEGSLNDKATNIDVSSLIPGTYVIKITGESNVYGDLLFVKE